MLYSTTTPIPDDKVVAADANTYRPFKILDTTVTQSVLEQIESLGEPETEGEMPIVESLLELD